MRRAVVVAMVLGATACASDGKSVRLSAVGDATESAESVRVKFAVEFDGVRSLGEGVMNLSTGDQRIESKVANSDTGSVSLLVDGRGFVGPLEEPASGPRWVRLPIRDDAELQVVSNEPAFDEIIHSLKKSAATLDEEGNGKVHGDRTTTYSFTVDPEAPDDSDDFFSAFRPAEGTVDVDDEGRLRRLVVRPTGKSSSDIPRPTLWSIELWDFGVDVDLEAPTRNVVDYEDPAATSLLKTMFGGDFPYPGDADLEDLPSQ